MAMERLVLSWQELNSLPCSDTTDVWSPLSLYQCTKYNIFSLKNSTCKVYKRFQLWKPPVVGEWATRNRKVINTCEKETLFSREQPSPWKSVSWWAFTACCLPSFDRWNIKWCVSWPTSRKRRRILTATSICRRCKIEMSGCSITCWRSTWRRWCP